MNQISEEFKRAIAGRSRSISFSCNPAQIKRWLEEDSIIELSLKQKTYRNAEFYINGKKNHCIWFSQLADPLLKVNYLELTLGKIIKKDGSVMCIRDITNTQFIEFVKNKQFKVIVNEEGACVKMASGVNMTYGEWKERIKILYNEGKYNEAAQLLEPANLYSLQEL
ncbi:MAG: hypothetical protein K2L45_09460 [Muribaculaceae bacterium]|nr:hypothetical protein [Muribaculaceae bacterium]